MSALALLATVLMAATGDAAKVGLPGWQVSRVDPVLAQALELKLATQLRDEGLQVISSRDIAAVMAVERQRQLLGCEEDQQSCMVELAGALGVDALVSGVLTRQGGVYLLELRLIDARSGAVIDARSARPRTTELLEAAIDALAPQLATVLAQKVGRALVPLESPSASAMAERSSARRAAPFITIAVGALVAGAGGLCFGLSKGDAHRLAAASPMMPLSELETGQLAHRGRTLEGVGLGLLVSGAVVLLASVVWLLVD